MQRFQSSDITSSKLRYEVLKIRIKRFQSPDLTFSKFGCNVFKVRMQRFQSSDITFSKLRYEVLKVRIQRFQSSDITIFACYLVQNRFPNKIRANNIKTEIFRKSTGKSCNASMQFLVGVFEEKAQLLQLNAICPTFLIICSTF